MHPTGLVWGTNLCLGSQAFLKGESDIDVADPVDHGMVVTAVGSMGSVFIANISEACRITFFIQVKYTQLPVNSGR